MGSKMTLSLARSRGPRASSAGAPFRLDSGSMSGAATGASSPDSRSYCQPSHRCGGERSTRGEEIHLRRVRGGRGWLTAGVPPLRADVQVLTRRLGRSDDRAEIDAHTRGLAVARPSSFRASLRNTWPWRVQSACQRASLSRQHGAGGIGWSPWCNRSVGQLPQCSSRPGKDAPSPASVQQSSDNGAQCSPPTQFTTGNTGWVQK